MRVLVPDYYQNFKCKCGDCRHCCCNGWDITLSYLEYCKLIGIPCSNELRRKLDCAFYFIKNGDNERYVSMKRNYFGTCPLQREDGLCGLQCECGEDALPSICRQYPRNISYRVFNEGACANSCERVVEMLLEEKDGLRFVEVDADVTTPEIDDDSLHIQKQAISFLQNRKLGLEERMIKLGDLLHFSGEKIEKVTNKELFSTLLSVIREIEEYSPTFSRFSIIAEDELHIVNEKWDEEYIEKRYFKAKEEFQKNFPQNEIFFENIMNNHLFFERFPYTRQGDTVFEKYIETCGVFVLLRFICIVYTEKRSNAEDLVDCVSGLFRCFEHSFADLVIRDSLRKMGKLSYPFVVELLKRI